MSEDFFRYIVKDSQQESEDKFKLLLEWVNKTYQTKFDQLILYDRMSQHESKNDVLIEDKKVCFSWVGDIHQNEVALLKKGKIEFSFLTQFPTQFPTQDKIREDEFLREPINSNLKEYAKLKYIEEL